MPHALLIFGLMKKISIMWIMYCKIQSSLDISKRDNSNSLDISNFRLWIFDLIGLIYEWFSLYISKYFFGPLKCPWPWRSVFPYLSSQKFYIFLVLNNLLFLLNDEYDVYTNLIRQNEDILHRLRLPDGFISHRGSSLLPHKIWAQDRLYILFWSRMSNIFEPLVNARKLLYFYLVKFNMKVMF